MHGLTLNIAYLGDYVDPECQNRFELRIHFYLLKVFPLILLACSKDEEPESPVPEVISVAGNIQVCIDQDRSLSGLYRNVSLRCRKS